MNIDFKQGLLYAWQEPHRVDAVFVPGAIEYVKLILSILITVIFAAVFHDKIDSKVLEQVPDLLHLPFDILAAIPIAGFCWHACATWRQEGLEAPPPRWSEKLFAFFLDGLKLFAYQFLLTLALAIVPIVAMIAIFIAGGREMAPLALLLLIPFALVALLAWPFFTTPLLYASENRRFADLWRFQETIPLTLKCYGWIWLAGLFTMGAGLLYGLVAVALCCTIIGGVVTCLGFPLAIGASYITYWHFLAQAHQSVWPELSADGLSSARKPIRSRQVGLPGDDDVSDVRY
ncbi:MAG: DUF4013 domain-containing protein [Candidatus Melainabacteria bacterium]|nr:DUF4013 domain-containing protein [Candidatus Melainabacteria bacterium]